MKNILKKYGGYAVMLLIIAALYGTLFAFGITCPIKFTTGISCPGCGISRACMSALRLDFLGAFSYNPMWITLPFVAASWFILKIKKKNKACDILLLCFCLTMIAVWLYRLISGTNPEVVGINIQESVIGKFIESIKNLLTK